SAQVSFQALDSADVTSAVSLSARLLKTDGGLATTATFTASNIGGVGTNQATCVAAAGTGLPSGRDCPAQTAPGCASVAAAPATELCTPVLFAVPDHISLTLLGQFSSGLVEGCAPQTFKVQMVDDAGTPLASTAPASFCATIDAGLVFGTSTF